MDARGIRQRLQAMMSHPFKPEPQYSALQKKLMELDSIDGHDNGWLLNQCNTNGVQLRNDFRYLQKCHEKDSNLTTPVLNPIHLEDFKNLNDVKNILKEMPSEWTVLLITKGFDPMDFVGTTKNHCKNDPTIFMSRLACGVTDGDNIINVVVPPKGNVVNESNIVQRLTELSESRRAYYKDHRDPNLAQIYKSTDSILQCYIKEVDSYWLREWKCLLKGRLVDSLLETNLHEEVKILILNSGVGIIGDVRKCSEIVYLLTLNCRHLKDSEILKALKHSFHNDSNYSGDSSELEILVDQLKSLHSRYSEAIKESRTYPVILILDNYFEVVPWEMTAVLTDQPVSRLLSLQLLYAMFKYHQPSIVNGYREVLVDSAFCLLNPGQDLTQCEENIGNFLRKELPWVEVVAGLVPPENLLHNMLKDCNLYLYCGHGSGTQYFPGGGISKSTVSCIVFLYGCCSNLPQGEGGRTPYQNSTYTFLTNGCSCLIGALYDLTSSDADLACVKTLSLLLSENSDLKDDGDGGSDLLIAAVEGKNACKKIVTKCALVSRGIPVKIKRKLSA